MVEHSLGEAGGWENSNHPGELRWRQKKDQQGKKIGLPWGKLWALQTAQRRVLHGAGTVAGENGNRQRGRQSCKA